MINRKGKVYILCSGYFKTGGLESLHLLCHTLRKKNIDAYMVYTVEEQQIGNQRWRVGHPGHGNVDVCPQWMDYISDNAKNEAYNIYDTIATKVIEDDPKNTLIVPEIYLNALNNFNNITKAVWWLASRILPDGSYKHDEWFNFNINREVYHLYNSKFAEHMLFSLNASRYFQLKTFVNENIISTNIDKEDIICYNPKKGIEFTNKIIKELPDYKFIPIKGMMPNEVTDALSKAKVYIDFGNHPGRERIPREAALCNCCVLLGFQGSAMFFEDTPILEKYKFEVTDDSIPNIINMIKNIISDYNAYSKDFNLYRNILKNNKLQFNIDVENLLV